MVVEFYRLAYGGGYYHPAYGGCMVVDITAHQLHRPDSVVADTRTPSKSQEPDTAKIDTDTASFDHELTPYKFGNVISLSYLCNVVIMHRLINHGHGQIKTSVVADTETHSGLVILRRPATKHRYGQSPQPRTGCFIIWNCHTFVLPLYCY